MNNNEILNQKTDSFNKSCSNIGKNLMVSAIMFENCLGEFLSAESNKIEYLIDKEASTEDLLEANRLVVKGLENIYLIEKQVLHKLGKGLCLSDCDCDCIIEE